MNDPQKSKKPYSDLGIKLKQIRHLSRESLAELSDATEIDVKQLSSFESGNARPSEEVLLMLISHYKIKDDDAFSLWEMAGYATDEFAAAKPTTETQPAGLAKQAVFILPIDSRVMFSDRTKVSINENGVILSFMQTPVADNSESIAVSRIGITKEHAKRLHKILGDTIKQSDSKSKNK